MGESAETGTPGSGILESFLEERNIKWLLATGVLILLASSLMMVTSHWREITPTWKCLTLAGCTGLVFLGGWGAYFRAGLRRTGTCLLGLTTLLLPINFLCLHWFGAAPAQSTAIRALLLPALLVLSYAISRKIFTHALRSSQRTFQWSYITLCAAGAAVPALPPAAAPWAGLLVWLVFAAGVVKVSRHVFWLVEEHRLPRICGFLPIGLLGSQFLVLFGLYFAPRIPLEWIGFGLALTAVPVFFTADAAARVFESRTGGIVKPAPLSISAPVGAGILLSVASLCLGAVNLFSPERNPLALVPSAAVVALLMGGAAHRTSRRAFSWAMHLAITIAYNFSPVFFRDTAIRAVHWSAAHVRETSLPFGFYGLTYLPLLIALSALGRKLARSGRNVFAHPVKAYVAGLGAILIATSWTHPKALFPVSAALWIFFTIESRLSGSRWLAGIAVASFVSAAYGLPAFAGLAFGIGMPAQAGALALCLASTALLAMPRWLDVGLCRVSSGIVAGIVAAIWLPGAPMTGELGWAAVAATWITALIAGHATLWQLEGIGMAAALFPLAALLKCLPAAGAGAPALLGPATLYGLAAWILGAHVLERLPGHRLTLALARPSRFVGGVLLATLVALGASLGMLEIMGHRTALFEGLLNQGAVPLALAWCFVAAFSVRNDCLAAGGAIGVLVWGGAVVSRSLGGGYSDWLPVVWSGIAGAAVPVLAALERRQKQLEASGRHDAMARWQAITNPLGCVLGATFGVIALESLHSFTAPSRIAGFVSLAGLLALSSVKREPLLRSLAWIPATWQVLWFAVLACAPGVCSPTEALTVAFRPAALPLGLLAAVAAVAFQRASARGILELGILANLHRLALRLVSATALASTLSRPELSAPEAAMAAAAFALLATGEALSACEHLAPARVWLAEAILLAGIVHLASFGWISFGHGISSFLLLGGALACRGLARLAERRPGAAVLAHPLRQTALVLPAGVVVLALFKQLGGAQVIWPGSNCLALFGAAGFYFWRGMEEKKKSLLAAGAVVANAALAILWRELRWSDPELFLLPIGASIIGLVQLLKEEIPVQWRDPLRYAGTLVTLVSPTFHIVEGSWVHLFSLLVCSMCVVLVAIGLRLKALLYTGTAFLVADLAAMVVRGGIENRNILWLAGLGLGALLIAIAALFENRKEIVAQRIRTLAAAIKEWR